MTVFRFQRTLEQNLTHIVDRYQHVASHLDDNLFVRLTMDVVNTSGQTGKKTARGTFLSLFLGDSKTLLSIMIHIFPELGLVQSDCIQTSWIQSVLFWTNFAIDSPELLLNRTPPSVTFLKRKSDYVKQPIPREKLDDIWKKMIELEAVMLTFNPYGGKMAEIPSTASPFPHRAGNLWKFQYATNWNEGGIETTNHFIDLTRELHKFMTPFVSKNPRQAFFNYKDLDIGINHNGRFSFWEGRVYGVKYFKENFNRLVKIKTEVDPANFFRHEQSIPTLPHN
ncbi:berberine bridge enzyme-like 8 [Carica papaya]|uniref:berberine bridge enzyme-like 8 n=1 Tax=Carica papaya TaxID=3649 RepID=UPI000B8CB022|nr:berberine bridge enzyme-like 8 [Carica papaya]